MTASITSHVRVEAPVLIEDQGEQPVFACSVGVMAHNEEANIARTLRAIFAQKVVAVEIREVIVVASGCTDSTVAIVSELAQHEERLVLCIQERREGKASAINLFLNRVSSPFVILLGADVIPAGDAFERICEPLGDPGVGMAGGRPVPLNDPTTFMGYTVHLLWWLHDRVARWQPKLGEIIVFRHIFASISTSSPVDEISIQAVIAQMGYGQRYCPECVVYNQGPRTVSDFLKQRRRIYAGHLKVLHEQRYAAATLRVWPVLRQLLAGRRLRRACSRRALWTVGAIVLEGWARLLGRYDYWRGHEHVIWQIVASTKDLPRDVPVGAPFVNSSEDEVKARDLRRAGMPWKP